MQSRQNRTTRLQLHTLERRDVPAVTASVVNATLTVQGDDVANNIVVSQSGASVTAAGQNFATTSFYRIVIDGGAGDDTISMAGVNLPGFLYGSSGNDRVTGGNGDDQIFGGHGNDTIDGGPGNDQLIGGTGTDVFSDAQGTNAANQGSALQTATQSDLENQIATLVNQQRAASGLAPLTVSVQLVAAAGIQSSNMVNMAGVVGESAAMSHNLYGTVAPNLTNRSDQVGFDYSYIGENIAYGYTSAQSVMDAWMASTGHRANILNSNYTHIGVAVRSTASGVMYFTQEFASPYTGFTPATGSSTTATVPTAGTPVSTAPVATTPVTTNSRTLVAVALDQGANGWVQVYDANTGAFVRTITPYGSQFKGGIRVATADVNGDGYDDVVTAAGAGGGPHVQAFDGRTGAVLLSFYAYDPGFTGGVTVAAADVDGDGKADIITGTGPGGGPHVKAFSGATGATIRSFYAYSPTFYGGVNVAAGDVDGDGKADIITGAGPGGGPHVQAFSGVDSRVIRSFFAYGSGFSGGVTVAAGDTDGDGKADIITGTAGGGGPHVEVFSGRDLAILQSFYAFDSRYTGGVRVGAADLDGDGKADLLLASGNGYQGSARGVSGKNLASLDSFLASDPSFLGGVYVG